ncbi:MAG TPA: LamG domain-containing protein [Polyangiaceae bacterium]|nr:LamG domain-containing protein [Polyangiaceae bacterium]
MLLWAVLALLCTVISCGNDETSQGPSGGTHGAGQAGKGGQHSGDAGQGGDGGQGNESGVDVTTKFEAPQEDVTQPKSHTPDFEPDFNNLAPLPGVDVVTDEQRDVADVYADRIEFPATVADVSKLSPGLIITSAGGKGAGKNPFGFARRVAKVELVGDKYVVQTTNVAITDIVEGDFQVQFTPDNSEDVDMSKLDVQWAIDNLYDNDENMMLERTILPADSPPDQVPAGLLGFFQDFFAAIGNAVIDAATGTWAQIEKFGNDIYKFITTGTFEESYSYNPTLGFKLDSDQALWPGPDSKLPALPLFTGKVNTSAGEVKVGLDGKLSYQAGAWFEPGLQVTGKFSVKEEPTLGFNMDSEVGVGVQFDMDVQASMESGGIKSLAEANKSSLAKELKGAVKDQLMSGAALTGKAYKYVLFVTKPRVKWIQAGPVPVAITMTMQVNLECDFAVQADIKAHADFSQRANLKFGAQLKPSSGGTVTQQPQLTFTRTHEFKFERFAGNLDAKCGLVPRVNVLLYDSMGVFAGVWGGVHATGSYHDDCGKGSPVDKSPDAVLEGKLAARVAIQVGGVIQPPGSSTLPDEKRKLLQPDKITKEVYSHEWPLLERSWTGTEQGLGWCPSTCPNNKKDPGETDLDCGGDCSIKCALGKKCDRNSECETGICNHKGGAQGVCSNDPCGDQVQDATETDIDCGGPADSCGRCALGKNCTSGFDCASGFCSGPNEPTPHVCSKTHCDNGMKDGDEGGVDCGGVACGKCKTGAVASSAADCASGFFNGSMCVATSCEDRLQDGDESAVDCGGSCPNRCQWLQACNTAADCDPVTAPACNLVTSTLHQSVSMKICASADHGSCGLRVNFGGMNGSDNVLDPNTLCASGVCKEEPRPSGGGTWLRCQSPTCTDGLQNGDEGDVDCGASCPNRCLCGQKCNSISDCDKECKECNFGHCGDSATQCVNNVLDFGVETDVDCGGVCPTKCAVSKKCSSGTDCELGVCNSLKVCEPPAGLVGAWPFHTSGQNALGVAYPSALYDGSYSGTSHRGSPLLAATFGGDVATLVDTTLGAQFTLAAWVKPRTPVDTARNALIGSAYAGAKSEAGFIWFMNSQGTDDLSMHFQTGDGANGGDYYTQPNVLKADVWQHVAVVVDRNTKSVTFFVNGVAVGGDGTFNEAFTDGRPLSIGATTGSEFPLNAYMEEVRRYSIALDGPAVLSLKNF